MNRIVSLVFVFCMSCNSNKKMVENYSDNKVINEFIKDGYSKAILLKGTKNNSTCEIVIKLESSGELLDPINMGDKRFEISSDESNIWLKYSSLRMMNRCEKARPINIIEIKKRDK